MDSLAITLRGTEGWLLIEATGDVLFDGQKWRSIDGPRTILGTESAASLAQTKRIRVVAAGPCTLTFPRRIGAVAVQIDPLRPEATVLLPGPHGSVLSIDSALYRYCLRVDFADE